tara:strand:- start:444 stop:719 length:276 start_codon:yes stop_codon:yes gene_type:complete
MKMGKLTMNQAMKLLEEGVLTNSALEEMKSNGLISAGRGVNRRYIKTADNTWVSPMLYFAGLKGAKYSKEMTELKNKINEIIIEHTEGEAK